MARTWQKQKEQSKESSMFGRILTTFLVNKELPFTSVDQAKVGGQLCTSYTAIRIEIATLGYGSIEERC